MLLLFIHTKEGSRVGAYCFLYGDVKERAAMLKSLKDHISTVAFSPYAFIVALVALSCVDDTTILSKNLLQPLIPTLTEVATHPTASRIIFGLLEEPSTTHFTQDDLKYINHTAMVPVKKSKAKDGEEQEEVKANEAGLVPASLKSSALRRSQLYDFMIEPLLEDCVPNIKAYVTSATGADIVKLLIKAGKKEVLNAVYELIEETSTAPPSKDVQMKDAKDKKQSKKQEEEESEEEEEDEEEEEEKPAKKAKVEKDDDDEEDDSEDEEEEDSDEEEEEEEEDEEEEEQKEYWTVKFGTRLMCKLIEEKDKEIVEKLCTAFKGNFGYWAKESSDASFLIRALLQNAEKKTRPQVWSTCFSCCLGLTNFNYF